MRKKGQKLLKDIYCLLEGQLQADGSLPGWAASDPSFTKAKLSSNTFISALALESLAGIEGRQWKACRRKLGKFLLSQKSPRGSFNYWIKDTYKFRNEPYPDDLDCTFYALAALYLWKPGLLEGKDYGQIALLLTSAEQSVGGPYRTWLVKDRADKVWQDVDLAVNCNIAYFLALQEVELPNLTVLFDKAIITNRLISPYYPSSYPIAYFISRFYKGNNKPELLEMVALLLGQANNLLDAALAFLALINLQADQQILQAGWEKLWHYRGELGKIYPICYDPFIQGKPQYCGSSALAGAYLAQAVSRWEKYELAQKSTQNRNDSEVCKAINKVETLYRSVFADCGEEIQKEAELYLEKIKGLRMREEIMLLPWRFGRSLRRGVEEKLLYKLCLVSLLGWVAYSIYDDFLDGEGRPGRLNLANVCLRRLSQLFSNKKDADRFNHILNIVDQANAWEIANCRLEVDEGVVKIISKLPDWDGYGQLAGKSFGHALGPLTIMERVGYGNSSPEYQKVESFFWTYLIAKQLSDDMHDWLEDLGCGRLNAVGAALIQVWRERNKRKNLLLAKEKKYLKEIFWKEVAEIFCGEILSKCKQAREALGSLEIGLEKKWLGENLAELEYSARLTLKEKKDFLDFQTAFTGNKKAADICGQGKSASERGRS